MERNSFSMPGECDRELVGAEMDQASVFHLDPLLLPTRTCGDAQPADVDALARDMADCMPVRIAILDSDLRIRALNAEWRREDLLTGDGLGLDFARACLVTAGEYDRAAIVAGLSRLRYSTRL